MAKIINEGFLDDLVDKFHKSMVDRTTDRFMKIVSDKDPEFVKVFKDYEEQNKKTKDQLKKALQRLSGK